VSSWEFPAPPSQIETSPWPCTSPTEGSGARRPRGLLTVGSGNPRDGSGSGKCGYDVYPPGSVPAPQAFARPPVCPRARISARTRARRIPAGTRVTRHPKKNLLPNPPWSCRPPQRPAEAEAEATPAAVEQMCHQPAALPVLRAPRWEPS
jgi:hypothetical protein